MIKRTAGLILLLGDGGDGGGWEEENGSESLWKLWSWGDGKGGKNPIFLLVWSSTEAVLGDADNRTTISFRSLGPGPSHLRRGAGKGLKIQTFQG